MFSFREGNPKNVWNSHGELQHDPLADGKKNAKLGTKNHGLATSIDTSQTIYIHRIHL